MMQQIDTEWNSSKGRIFRALRLALCPTLETRGTSRKGEDLTLFFSNRMTMIRE